MIFLIILCAAILIVLLIAYICYRMAFYQPDRKDTDPNAINLPDGEIYEKFKDSMERWIREARAMPHKEYSIRSFDGLTLYGNYYEYTPEAPIELMFHGYRGDAERDLSGGVQRCFKLGHSAFVVSQRCSGKSEGNTITFGINERKDCLKWVEFLVRQFGTDVRIILTGISMGAATVLMTSASELPKNVIGVLADCGYSSAKEIIKVVIRKMGLPANLAYPFVKLGAKLYGHFDLEETTPLEAMEKCKVPVIFFHGEDDDFVPCEMSKENYNACTSKKRLVTVPGAGHGLSYPVAPEKYLQAMKEFFGE